MLGEPARKAVYAEIADLLLDRASGDTPLARYALDYLVWYLVQLDRPDEALETLTSVEWWQSAFVGTGGPSAMGRQIRYVESLTLVRGHTLILELLKRVIAFLTQSDELPADVVIARVADVDVEDYLKNVHDPRVRSSAASVLARRLHRTGNEDASHRVALHSIAAAAECYELEIPDAMTAALRQSLRLHPDLEAASGEHVERWLEELDSTTQLRFRTIIASELLPFAPALSARLILPVVDLLERQATHPGEDDDIRHALTLALPSVALRNSDLGEVMAEGVLEQPDLAFVRAVGRIASGSNRLDLIDLDDDQLADLARLALALGKSNSATRITSRIASPTTRSATLALVALRNNSEPEMTEALAACETQGTTAGKLSAYSTVVQFVADFDLAWAAKIASQVLDRLEFFASARDFRLLVEPLLEVLATYEPTSVHAKEVRDAHPAFRDDEWVQICNLELVDPFVMLVGRMLSEMIRSGTMTWGSALDMGHVLTVDFDPVYDEIARLLVGGQIGPAELISHLETVPEALQRTPAMSVLWPLLAVGVTLDPVSRAALLALLGDADSRALQIVEDVLSTHTLLASQSDPYSSEPSRRRLLRLEPLAKELRTATGQLSSVIGLASRSIVAGGATQLRHQREGFLPLPLRWGLSRRLLGDSGGVLDALDEDARDALFTELSYSWTGSLAEMEHAGRQ